MFHIKYFKYENNEILSIRNIYNLIKIHPNTEFLNIDEYIIINNGDGVLIYNLKTQHKKMFEKATLYKDLYTRVGDGYKSDIGLLKNDIIIIKYTQEIIFYNIKQNIIIGKVPLETNIVNTKIYNFDDVIKILFYSNHKLSSKLYNFELVDIKPNENECQNCRNPIYKGKVVYPCGHSKFCIECFNKIGVDRCYICTRDHLDMRESSVIDII